MKFFSEGKRDLLTRGSVLAIAGFSIFVLVQNGCSDSVTNGPADAGTTTDSNAVGGCFAGESLTKVGSQTLCCSGTPPTLVCTSGGRVGDPCTGSSAPAPQVNVNVTLDVCVSDSCDGNRSPTTYDGKTVATTTPLTCDNGTLVASGDSTTQDVERVCSVIAPLSCANTSYSYAYGYVTSYGYGYYGGTELMTRAVSVSSSTCATGSGAPAACDVGSY